PADWEETGIDISEFIKGVNSYKKASPVFSSEGHMEQIQGQNPAVLCLRKESEDNKGQGYILINTDHRNNQEFEFPREHDYSALCSEAVSIFPSGSNGAEIFEQGKMLLPPGFFMAAWTKDEKQENLEK
ncbi:MAG: hypothetical protein ACLFQK_09740, partial [Fibrobacterota bacterium]